MAGNIYKGSFENTGIVLTSELFSFLEDNLEPDRTVYLLHKKDLEYLAEQADTEEKKKLVEDLKAHLDEFDIIPVSIQ